MVYGTPLMVILGIHDHHTHPSCGKVDTSHHAWIANRGDTQNNAGMAGRSHSCADRSTPCIPGFQGAILNEGWLRVPKIWMWYYADRMA